MPRINFIVPECFVETNMARTFLNAMVNHQYGCGAVTRTMTVANRLKDGLAIGLIDDDKKKSSYAEAFSPIGTIAISDEAHIDVMYHEDTHHYLIVTHPAMEQMMIDCADLAGIKMEKYGLSGDLEILKKYTKDNQSDEDKNIKKLFNVLSADPTSPLGRLKSVLNYMVENKYQIDRGVLAQMLE